MATFSRSHQFASAITPAWLPATAHNIHGRRSVTFWSDGGATYDLNITRTNGVSVIAVVGAAPANFITFALVPGEKFSVQARSAGPAPDTINVLVI